jgi:glycosyltransferase involved in cell wall biosynthesis
VPRKVIPSIDLFICNSRYTQKNLEETLKKLTLHATSEIISMPTSTALHESSDEGVRRLEKVVAQIPRPFYLFLGRVTFDKGADVFAELARRFPDRGFLVCGEGPLVKELKSLGFRNLTFAGKIGEEKSWAFQNCEALIIPSRSPETSSLIIAESHPYGTPVVYPSGGGAEETFKALKRSGCPLEEFKGQNFVKSESTQGFSNSDFDKSLASCLDR